MKSTLFAEDPESPGGEPLSEGSDLGPMVLVLHYSDIAAKIRQPILATSLPSGLPVPEQNQFPAAVWEFRSPPLEGKRFVGGQFPGADGVAPIQLEEGPTVFLPASPWRLDVGRETFFGVEENVFKGLCAIARSGDRQALQVYPLPDALPLYSAISSLRDGSIIGPVEFFNPAGLVVYQWSESSKKWDRGALA